jgi:hypothetical protein
MCDVLRCGNTDLGKIIDYQPPGYPLLQVGVCAVHAAEIDSGAEWRVEADGQHILMGTDIAVAGFRIVESYDGITQDMTTVAAGEHMLRIDVTLRGGEQAHALIDKRELDAAIRDYISVYPGLDDETH